MRRELVFTAYPGRAELARRITLAEAGLKERADLQEWIRAHPQLLGPGVRIVTYEFDKWVSGSGSHATVWTCSASMRTAGWSSPS